MRSANPTEAHGAFSWVGLLTGDVEAARRFYADLFGWTVEAGETPDAHAYCLMRLRGQPVALVYGMADWQREAGAPTNWATFVSVADVHESAARAVELGGGVAIAPYPVEGVARIAVITDPGGARLSLWEPLGDLAPLRGGSVGRCCWNELATREPAAAGSFYAGLFGWELEREPSGYRIVSNRGVPQGDMRALGASRGGRAHWLPYFRVGSVDNARERCARAGGDSGESSGGDSVAVLRDRQGASFGVCARMPSASGGESATAPARARDP